MSEKRRFFSYTEEDVTKAMAAVQAGMSTKEAHRKFGVPRATLWRKLTGKNQVERRMGPVPSLGIEIEERIAQWIKDLASQGFPVTRHIVFFTVKKFLDDKEVSVPYSDRQMFKENMPGEKWWKLFLGRHKELVEKTSEVLTRARGEVTEEALRSWFGELETHLRAEGQFEILKDPSRVFNADESGFLLSPKTGKVIGLKGKNDLYSVQPDNYKEQLTVMAAFSASGLIVPPMVLYPYVRIPDKINKTHPKGWGIGATPSGWMTGETFFGYIGNHFVPSLKEAGVEFPIILFIDGHKSHLTLQASELCRGLGIILVSLYPNSTHILQPADVSVFKPLNAGWSKVVKEWKYRNFPEEVTRQTFAQLLFSVFDTLTKDSTVNGFKKCGIFPFDANAVDYFKCIEKRIRGEQSRQSQEKDLFLKHLETYIIGVDSQLMEAFKKRYHHPWNGDKEASMLYDLWRIKTLESEGNRSGVGPVGTGGIEEPKEQIDSGESNYSNIEMEMELVTTENEEARDDFVLADGLQSTEDIDKYKCNETPSPFKKCFFYPKLEENKKYKRKLILPSVVTTDAYKEYLEKKEREKLEMEAAKLKRKEEREEKRLKRSQEKSKNYAKKRKEKMKKQKMMFDDETEEEETYSLHDDSEGSDFCENDDEDRNENVGETVTEGSFIVSEFLYDQNTRKEKKKLFVGEVLQVSDFIKASFLRKENGKKADFYVFPDVRDIQNVKFSEVVRVLKPCQIVRGRYYFKELI